MRDADLAIVGAGAAGLAATVFAAESAPRLRILLLDGAKKPGAKILVSGGGRCNVTHEVVRAEDFNGGPRAIVRKVLRAFDERQTRDWMASLGVELRAEPSGKLFPTTDSARTVLDALLSRVHALRVTLLTGTRVHAVERAPRGFVLRAGDDRQPITTRALIMATGGLALPKSGSDGAGLAMLEAMGHRIVPVTPALVPLTLAPGPDLGGRFAEFRGLALQARLDLVHADGKLLAACEGAVLFTHFGISGPATLDISRHLLRQRLDRPGETFELRLSHPQFRGIHEADAWLRAQREAHPRKRVARAAAALWPERWAEAVCEGATTLDQLTRAQRETIAARLAALPLPVAGDRGYAHAETSAGGVDLREIDARTMASRIVPGLFLCGELLDVDGRIGGFNFQWAWASGYLAGRGAAKYVGSLPEAT